MIVSCCDNENAAQGREQRREVADLTSPFCSGTRPPPALGADPAAWPTQASASALHCTQNQARQAKITKIPSSSLSFSIFFFT